MKYSCLASQARTLQYIKILVSKVFVISIPEIGVLIAIFFDIVLRIQFKIASIMRINGCSAVYLPGH